MVNPASRLWTIRPAGEVRQEVRLEVMLPSAAIDAEGADIHTARKSGTHIMLPAISMNFPDGSARGPRGPGEDFPGEDFRAFLLGGGVIGLNFWL